MVQDSEIKRKLTLFLVIFGFFPALIVFLTFYFNQQSFKDAHGRYVESVAASISEVINKELLQRYQEIKLFTTVASSKTFSKNTFPLTTTMNKYVADYKTYKLMMLLDARGNLVAVNTIDMYGNKVDTNKLYTTNFSNEAWFKNAITDDFANAQSNQFGIVVSQPSQQAIVKDIYKGDDYSISLSKKISNPDGIVKGVWVNFIDFASIEEIFKNKYEELKTQNLGHTELTLLDSKGKILVDYDPIGQGWTTYERNFDTLGKLNLAEQGVLSAKKVVAGNNGNIVSVHARKKLEQVAGYHKSKGVDGYPKLNWSVLVRVPVDEAYAVINSVQAIMLFTISSTIILILGFGWYLGKAVSKPVDSLISDANFFKQFYRDFIESSVDAMLVIRDGKFVDCNAASIEMLGFENRQELYNTQIGELSPLKQADGQHSVEKAQEMIGIALEKGKHRFEWLYKRKNEGVFPVEVTLIALNQGGTVVLNVVLRDMSEHYKLKEVLLETRLLGEAVKQSGSSIMITDTNGVIEYANPAFTEMNGFSNEETIGKRPSILGSGFQNKEFYQEMWDTVVLGDIWNGTLRNKRKNGDLYWARSRVSPVKDENGNIHHFVGIETDISEFVDAKEKAEKANKAKSEFLSSMSHELRTPLNSIIGFSQIIEMNRKQNLNDKQLQQVSQIKNAGNHLLQLIDEVLDLARVESGKLPLSIEDINFKSLLTECLDLVETAAEKNSVDISILKIEDNIQLKADRLRLKQAVLNFLSNAVKYNKEDGQVWIDGHAINSTTYRISIVDSGIGIPESKYDDVFVSFNRLGAENTGVEGTGIGLSLTKILIEEMDGKIGFNSVHGKSTTFWIELPFVNNKAVHDDVNVSEDISIVECCDSLHTVLYIEDNPTNLEVMECLIDEIENLKMISAVNGTHGLSLASGVKPHLILLDMNLPDMPGLQVFEALKNDISTKDIPVVIVSADAMPETIQKAMDLGVNEYITKPFKMTDVMAVLNKYIETKS